MGSSRHFVEILECCKGVGWNKSRSSSGKTSCDGDDGTTSILRGL